MFSLFPKKPDPVLLEEQLKELAACGITLNPQASLDDLLGFNSREEYEAEPYKELIPVLGFEMERDAYAPLCDRLWMCDYERIEGSGSYANVITRLQQMSKRSLSISGITDHVDIEQGTAWVEFELAGSRIHWDAKFNNDWLDDSIVGRFENLLESRSTPFHLYSNHREFGQSAFFACLRLSEFERFQKLATFKLREVKKCS